MDRTDAAKFKICSMDDIYNMRVHGQMTVERDTKIFFTELEKETEASPIDRELGKLAEVDFLLEETIITSVLSSFNFSLLMVIHDLMSLVHATIDCRRSGI